MSLHFIATTNLIRKGRITSLGSTSPLVTTVKQEVSANVTFGWRQSAVKNWLSNPTSLSNTWRQCKNSSKPGPTSTVLSNAILSKKLWPSLHDSRVIPLVLQWEWCWSYHFVWEQCWCKLCHASQIQALELRKKLCVSSSSSQSMNSNSTKDGIVPQ